VRVRQDVAVRADDEARAFAARLRRIAVTARTRLAEAAEEFEERIVGRHALRQVDLLTLADDCDVDDRRPVVLGEASEVRQCAGEAAGRGTDALCGGCRRHVTCRSSCRRDISGTSGRRHRSRDDSDPKQVRHHGTLPIKADGDGE
jgi:hypothetical protein